MDDDRLLCRKIRSALEFEGHTLNCFHQIRDFLEHAAIDKSDVIILDRMIRSPEELKVNPDEHSGDALFRKLRNDGITNPVIFLSALDKPPEVMRLSKAGQVALIVKPLLGSGQLLRTVEEL